VTTYDAGESVPLPGCPVIHGQDVFPIGFIGSISRGAQSGHHLVGREPTPITHARTGRHRIIPLVCGLIRADQSTTAVVTAKPAMNSLMGR
jgi:hypothetical protein